MAITVIPAGLTTAAWVDDRVNLYDYWAPVHLSSGVVFHSGTVLQGGTKLFHFNKLSSGINFPSGMRVQGSIEFQKLGAIATFYPFELRNLYVINPATDHIFFQVLFEDSSGNVIDISKYTTSFTVESEEFRTTVESFIG